MAGKAKISYFYDPDVGNFYYGQVRHLPGRPNNPFPVSWRTRKRISRFPASPSGWNHAPLVSQCQQ